MHVIPFLRFHQARYRCLYVVDQVVDDAVRPDAHTPSGRQLGGSGVEFGLEPNDDRVRSGGQHDVRFGYGARSGRNDVDLHFPGRKLLDCPADCVDRTLCRCLDDHSQFLELAPMDAAHDFRKGRGLAGLTPSGGNPATRLHKLPGSLVVGHHFKLIADGR